MPADIKSHHLFTWDSEGKIDSPFAHEPNGNHFEVRLDTLRMLHVPDYWIRDIREIREKWVEENVIIPLHTISLKPNDF